MVIEACGRKQRFGLCVPRRHAADLGPGSSHSLLQDIDRHHPSTSPSVLRLVEVTPGRGNRG